jgi:hypothetical protein
VKAVEATLIEGADAMVAASALDLETDTGDTINVWTIAREGAFVRASAPRLEVRAGMRLVCRLVIGTTPHLIVLVVAEAVGHSAMRATIRLEVVSARVDPLRRKFQRADLEVPVTLTARICQRVVPDEAVSGVIHNVSEGGVGVVVADLRPRDKDLYRLELRSFEGVVRQEIRVQSRRPGPRPGSQLLGCEFMFVSSNTVDVMRKLSVRLTHRTVDGGPALRDELGIATALPRMISGS